jgi:predicted O-linked N-acetylglucosamine transferase (SPINDLY family)
LGVVRHQRGDHVAALGLIGRAIAIDPHKAVCWNNYGAALHSLGRHVEALACFHHALEIRPQYADAVANRGMAQESLGQDGPAEASFRRALELQPGHADALKRLAGLLQKLGRFPEAARTFCAALRQRPTADLHVAFGNLLIATGRADRAAAEYEKAIGLEPNSASAHFNLGSAYQEQLRVEEAKKCFDRAAALRPKRLLWRLRGPATSPAVFGSNEEIDAFRDELGRLLDQSADNRDGCPTWNDLLTAGVFPTFTFSYHGRNNRALKEKFAALYEGCFDHAPPPTGSGLKDRKRIGFVVTQRHEGIFLRCMKGIVQGLDRQRFEVVVLCSRASVEMLSKGLGESASYKLAPQESATYKLAPRVLAFGNSLREAVDVTRQAACDVLYYWEVGSDAINYFLPFARPAPVQCTSHGSQITSGVPAVDWFISSRLIESEAAQEQYTEKLWLSRTLLMCQARLTMDGLGSPSYEGDGRGRRMHDADGLGSPPYEGDGLGSPSYGAARAKFGLPEGRNLYLCFQNPMKLHPDFDPLLAGILAADLKALVVLLAGRYEHAARLLRERFARRVPDAERIVFLPAQPFDDYCRLLGLADVVLDPPHFGAGSTCYDIFSFNLPLVTLPGELIVGRVAAALYRKMGMEELVVQSPEQYVAAAVRVATDRQYRGSVTGRIAASSHAIFDDLDAVREHERFFTEVSA